MTDSIIIGYDTGANNDNTILIVGRKEPGQVVNVINAFQGAEAEELYKRLITKKEANS